MHQQEGPGPQTWSLVHATPSGWAAPVGARRRIVEVDGHAQARSWRRPRSFLTCQASAHRSGERGDLRMSMGRAVYDDRNSPDDLLQLPSARFGRLSSNLHRHRTAVMVGSIERHKGMRKVQLFPYLRACGAVRSLALLPCELTSSCLCVERVMRKVHVEDSASEIAPVPHT